MSDGLRSSTIGVGRYVRLRYMPLPSYLDRGEFDRPLLCVSDTHLFTHDAWYADDAPVALQSLFQAHPGHRILVLGDFLESLAFSSLSLRRIGKARRLAPIFNILQHRRGSMVLLGNHDERAASELESILGPRCTRQAFTIGGISFHHGHDVARDYSSWVAGTGQWLIPLGVTLNRLGLRAPPRERVNRQIARAWERKAQRIDFQVFGHTHIPELRTLYANTGCFLQEGRRTFITVDKSSICLWEEKQ